MLMDVRFVWCGMEVQAEGDAEECAQLIAGLIRSEGGSEEPCDLTGFGVDDLPPAPPPRVLKVLGRSVSVTDRELDAVRMWREQGSRGDFPVAGLTEREQSEVVRMTRTYYGT
jgi:hypothetical protein